MNRCVSSVQFIIFFIIAPFLAHSQYSHPEMGYVFDDTTVPRVDIEIHPDFLSSILDIDNLDSDTEYPATFYFTKNGVTDTVNTIGFRLRGNSSRRSAKKSFKVSFNSTVQGQKYKGLEKMNLNGEHNDPSILRAKMCWDLYTQQGIPGSRSNHVELYINEEYRGLYINVEHIDEQYLKHRFSSNDGNLYKCLYPADLAYKGEDPDLYKEVIYGRRAYDLKNSDTDDYSDFAHFVDVLNNTDSVDFQCEIEKVFDVENYLKVIAMDILVSNWDGPIINKNNFYLYHDPETDRFVYLPFDLDNTMGVGWGNTIWWETYIYNWTNSWGVDDRPIFQNIMRIEEYRNKVSYYFFEYIQTFFNNSTLDPYLDNFHELLLPFREDDTYANLDYGWDANDFSNSFSESVANHVKIGFKQYIGERGSSVLSQLELKDPLSIMKFYKHKWTESEIEVYADVEFPYDMEGEVSISFQVNDAEWQTQEMVSETGIYKFSIPHEQEGVIRYIIELKNFAGTLRYPHCGEVEVLLGVSSVSHPVINELMASNGGTIADDEGEFDDWIEIYNPTAVSINLSNYYITDDRERPDKWHMPDMNLPPDSYSTVWADEDGEQGENHANFKLSKDGEFLGLYALEDGVYFPIDTLSFPEQDKDVSYGRIPNGSGIFQFLSSASFGSNNEATSEVSDYSSEENIDLYPNPTNGTVNIQSYYDVQSITVYDQVGRKKRHKQFLSSRSNYALELGDLSKGIYLIEIETTVKERTFKRIVVQ